MSTFRENFVLWRKHLSFKFSKTHLYTRTAFWDAINNWGGAYDN